MKMKFDKPDIETESFRVWASDKSKKDYMKDHKKQNPIFVKYKDFELGLLGFNKVRDEKTNKIVFYYKFKNESREFYFYIPKNLSKKNQERVKQIKSKVEEISLSCGNILINVEDLIKEMYNEKNTFSNLRKLKGG